VERVNRTLREKMSIAAAYRPRCEEWHTWLPAIAYSINNADHEATGRTPYELVFGRKNPSPIDIDLSLLMRDMSEQDSIRDQLREEQKFRELLRQGTIDERAQKGRFPISFTKNDQVLVRNQYAHIFDEQFSGPHPVIGVMGRKVEYLDAQGRVAVADVGDVKKYSPQTEAAADSRAPAGSLRRQRRRQRERRLEVVVTPPVMEVPVSQEGLPQGVANNLEGPVSQEGLPQAVANDQGPSEERVLHEEQPVTHPVGGADPHFPEEETFTSM
jgi:hypothetical protein